MLSVNAVPKRDVFSAVIGPSRRKSARSSVSVRQINPRPYLAMKFTASGVQNSAAMVRSPSFSRSSSSTTTTIRPARNAAIASSIFANINAAPLGCLERPAQRLQLVDAAGPVSDPDLRALRTRAHPELRPNAKAPPAKGGAWWHRRPVLWCNKSGKQDLQGGLNLESPGLKQGLRDVLRILVSPSPLPQPRRADILIGSQLEFLNHLFERGYGGNDRSDRLRLAPIWISTTLCHLLSVPLPVLFLRNPCFER